jgi:hypothetical protein
MIKHLRMNAVAYVALFVALGGTGYAASQIGSADIAPNAVRSKHIAKNQVKRGDVHKGSLSKLFGAGVLGGEAVLPAAGAGNLSFSQVAPIGAGAAFSVPAPRPLRVRQLEVREVSVAQVPNGRSVIIGIRNDDTTQVLSCAISGGQTACSNGNATLKLARGELLEASVVSPAGGVAIPQLTFEFGYRAVP